MQILLPYFLCCLEIVSLSSLCPFVERVTQANIIVEFWKFGIFLFVIPRDYRLTLFGDVSTNSVRVIETKPENSNF